MSPLLQPPGLGVGGTLGTVRGNEAPEVRLRWPGLDPLRPTLDILIFDDSGSLTGQGGNDPVGNRYAEAGRAVRLLSHWSRSSRQQVATIHFDYPAVAVTGPHRLDRSAPRQRVLAALHEPRNALGSSALTPAMTAANKLAREHGGICRCTIFSDFELMDANPNQPYEEAAKFPGLIHAIVLNASPPHRLTRLNNVTTTHIASDSPPGLTAAALMHSLATGRRGARRSVLRMSRPRDPADRPPPRSSRLPPRSRASRAPA